jgi:hypothetical protein
MSKRILLYLVFFVGFSNSVRSQYYYHEIGVVAGPVFLKSDFGARDDFKNFYANNGYNIGIVYYISGDNDYNSLRDNFKLRLEAGYMQADLKHYGQYVDKNSGSLFETQLKAMSGTTSAISAGAQIEFYPLKTDDYSFGGTSFVPYVSLGAQANLYSSEIKSSLGKFGTASTTPTKYLDGYRNDVSKFVPSISSSIGTRFKLSEYHSLMAEVKLQFYFSDWVDGLNPNSKVYTENKSNDYLGSFNIGYIYYLDQD